MDLQSLLPVVDPVMLAGATIMAAIAAGWLVARAMKTPIARRVANVAGGSDVVTTLRPIIAALVATIVLLVIGAGPWTGTAELVLSAGAGIAIAILLHRLARTAGLGEALSVALGLGAGVMTMLRDTPVGREIGARLEAVAFGVGKMRLSLLDLANVALSGLLAYVLFLLARRVLRHYVHGSTTLDATQAALVGKVGNIILVMLAIIVALTLAGIDLTALAVFSGAFGIAAGFGMQKTLGNLVSGIILLLDRSITPGDVITVDRTIGRVRKVGARAVTVTTRDGRDYLVPNETLMTGTVVNWSNARQLVRVTVKVGVAYGSDLDCVARVMVDAVRQVDRVLPDPAPNVWITDFAEKAIEHEVHAWIADPESGVGNVQSAIRHAIWRRFRDERIDFAAGPAAAAATETL